MISVISIKAAPFAALPGATLSLAALRAIASALFASSFCRLTIGTRIRAGVRSSIRAAFRPAISAAIRSACAALPPVAFGSVTFRESVRAFARHAAGRSAPVAVAVPWLRRCAAPLAEPAAF